MEKKFCFKCKAEKPVDEFNNRGEGKQPYCALCSSTYSKVHYQTNSVAYKVRINLRKQEIKNWFGELKATLKCSRCPETHPATLDFHHRDPSTKEGSVSDLIATRRFSKERLIKEINKCEVLCANCHRKEHYKE